MAMQSHLAELERRHETIEEQIHAAQTHPSTDALELVSLKRRKLKIKEEIIRIRSEAILH